MRVVTHSQEPFSYSSKQEEELPSYHSITTCDVRIKFLLILDWKRWIFLLELQVSHKTRLSSKTFTNMLNNFWSTSSYPLIMNNAFHNKMRLQGKIYCLSTLPCVTNMFSIVQSFGDNDKVPLAFFPLPHLNVDHIWHVWKKDRVPKPY